MLENRGRIVEKRVEEDPRDKQINELIKANTDLDNLLLNAEIGALYIDSDMRIRKITPIMAKNTNLKFADTGRMIDEVDFIEGYDTLTEDVRAAMLQKKSAEHEIFMNGKTWLLRIHPYYLNKENASGVIATMYDVTKRLSAVKQEMNGLMNSIPGGVCKMEYNDGLVIQYANDSMYTLMKTTPEAFAEGYGNHYEKLLLPEDWEELQQKIEESIKTGNPLQAEYTVHYEGREEEWRLMQASIMQCDENPVLQCVIADITEIKRIYFSLEQEREKLNVIADMTSDRMFEYDIETDTMDYFKQGENEGLIGEKRIKRNYAKTIIHTENVHPEDRGKLQQFCEELSRGKSHIFWELRKRYSDGKYHWIELEGTTIYDDKGKPVKVIGRSNNIDDRKEQEEYLKYCSEVDSLTRLYNRQVMEEKVKARLRKVSEWQTGWLVIVDVDNFKELNESKGHLVGDAVLCMIADELRSSFKDSLIGRIGGDEFMIFTEKMPRTELESILNVLGETIQGLYQDEEQEKNISCSAGIVCCDETDKDFESLFEWADYALYKVKQENKNGYYIVEKKEPEGAPEIGFLTREEEDEYIREESAINTVDELVLFALELLGGMSDMQNSFRLVSDRICSFFDIDDIVLLGRENGVNEKKYHWSRKKKKTVEGSVLPDSPEAWEYICGKVRTDKVCTLHRDKIKELYGGDVGSALFVQCGRDEKRICIAFVDRVEDRKWETEKESFGKLANILYNHWQQMQESEREKCEQEFRNNYDSVTCLPQYHMFVRLSEQYVREHSDEQAYFVYSDFANFQYINEFYGYKEGDKLLEAFAQKLKSLSHGIYFCRVSSDHFVGLMSGKDEEAVREEFKKAADEFCDAVKETHEQSNLVIVAGLSHLADKEESLALAIDRANIARKYGKDTTTTTVVIYDQSVKDRNESEKTITASMQTALENGEFKAWLQPKVSLKTGKIIGAEALVRWQRDDGSMIYPDRFIPVFEKNGFITKVDFAVLDQVLDYMREAMDLGEEVEPVSVNFSRRHNEDEDFVDEVLTKLKSKRIPAKYLEAELTESVFMLDLNVLMDNVSKMKQEGITISIDDFGSGYSSLNVLANVEADVIKLDRQFLDYTAENSKSPAFIKYLIKMMKRLGYRVIAEGVETEEQLEFLRNAECDMVQGYYYARPMPIEKFREFLKEFNKAG